MLGWWSDNPWEPSQEAGDGMTGLVVLGSLAEYGCAPEAGGLEFTRSRWWICICSVKRKICSNQILKCICLCLQLLRSSSSLCYCTIQYAGMLINSHMFIWLDSQCIVKLCTAVLSSVSTKTAIRSVRVQLTHQTVITTWSLGEDLKLDLQ